MTPAEYRDEKDFKELCRISTQTELPIREEVSRAIERMDAIGPNVGQKWEETRTRLTYSLFCQSGVHHNCHSQVCGCSCHATGQTNETIRTLSRSPLTTPPPGLADPYWATRAGRPVGTSEAGNVGWRGYGNDPTEQANQQASVSPAIETDPKILDEAFDKLERMEKVGMGMTGEARRLKRLLLFSGVEPPAVSNWRDATRTIEESPKPIPVAVTPTRPLQGRSIIVPSKIQTCPFPSSREIWITDQTGVTVKAYIPEEEIKHA